MAQLFLRVHLFHQMNVAQLPTLTPIHLISIMSPAIGRYHLHSSLSLSITQHESRHSFLCSSDFIRLHLAIDVCLSIRLCIKRVYCDKTKAPSEKVQLWLIGSRLRAFQWAEDEQRTLSLNPQFGYWGNSDLPDGATLCTCGRTHTTIMCPTLHLLSDCLSVTLAIHAWTV